MSTVSLEAELIMELEVLCPDRPEVGGNETGFLKVIQITGGTFKGEKLSGKVVPGGADWNLSYGDYKENNVIGRKVFAKYLLQTDDGIYIAIENLGYRLNDGSTPVIATNPSFFAPEGKYHFLNYGVYVGSLEGKDFDGVRGVHIKIYKML